jgi:hypothetical protein
MSKADLSSFSLWPTTPVELELSEKIRSRPNARVFLINTEGVIDLNLDYSIDGVTQEEIL